MEQVSDRLAKMAASETIAMNQRFRDLKARGVDVINLGVGEPDFNTPDHIKQAAKKAIDDNYSFYPPVAGYPQLKEAIVKKLKNQNNLDYLSDQIVVSSGAKHSIVNTLLCVINKGDEVIIPAPYWVSYSEQVKLAEGSNVILNSGFEEDFKVRAHQIEQAITSRTRALMLCSPSNPSGSIYSREELSEIAEVLRKHPRILVISDEIYEHLNYSGKHESIAQFDFLKERVVLVNGVSKAYAMTGWRVGYLAGPVWLANAVTKLQGQFTSGATSVAQITAAAALNGDQNCVEEMKMAFRRRRDLVFNEVVSIHGVKCTRPQGAFYVFPDMSYFFNRSAGDLKIKDSSDLCMYLLEHAHISTVPGSAFGTPECIRISFANSDENLKEGMKRLKMALSELI